MSVSARVSLTLAVQSRTDGPFPAMQTYPASFERLVLPGGDPEPKVFALTGQIPEPSGEAPGSVVLNLAGSLATVRYWYVENLSSPDEDGVSDVVVSGGPVNATVHRGQVLLATNERVGWPAGSVTLAGTPGAAFKVIAIGG